ncbi:hypothetical protein ACIGO8_02475 [Streptomyces sp. NPDC053493]|uniref:hypothetical protein n=1 Tax=Streptomyces sp. NPDC053493 TaxID=3365705 RepID=UPI0037D5CFB1
MNMRVRLTPSPPRRREEAIPVISSIKNVKTSTAKMTDLSVVSACTLGLSASASSALLGSGLSGAGLPVLGMPGLLMDRPERNERPTKALEAGVVGKAQAPAYGFAATATGAGIQQTTQHHTMWAFRGLEPWSDPA